MWQSQSGSALYGGVAQLGERTVRIRKVESSILFVSTKKKSLLSIDEGDFFNDVRSLTRTDDISSI